MTSVTSLGKTSQSSDDIKSSRFPLRSQDQSILHRSSSAIIPQVKNSKIYFNSARNQLYSRFTPQDWTSSNNAHFKLSESERANATRLKSDVWKTVKETEHKTRSRQAEVNKKLSERVQDISMWRQELDQEIRLLENEQENLKEILRVLKHTLQHTEKPLRISEHCFQERECRQGIDQVQDSVEKSLVKEVECIRKCQARMKCYIQKGDVQTKLNRAAQHECEKDLNDKSHSHGLDDKMYHLKNTTIGINRYPGIELFDNTVSIPVTWTRFTHENITRSQRCRASSESLRSDIDLLIRNCANEMWGNFSNVNNSLLERVQDITNARNKLQAHMQRTVQEIFDTEKSINLLKRAIADKEFPLKVAETRLEERSKRFNVELCNDPAMKTLQKEIFEIKTTIRQLKDQKRSSEIVLNRLNRTRSLLENEIAIKENSLLIDQKNCLGVRKTFPMEPKVGPVLEMPLLF